MFSVTPPVRRIVCKDIAEAKWGKGDGEWTHMVTLSNRQWVCSKDTWFVDGVGFFWSHAVSHRTWLGDCWRICSLFVDKDFREGGVWRAVPATTGPSAGAETRPPVQGRSEAGEEVEFSVAATALKLQGRTTTPLNRGETRRRPRRRRRRKKKRRRWADNQIALTTSSVAIKD